MDELGIFVKYNLEVILLQKGVYKVLNPEDNIINIAQFEHEFYDCSVLATDAGINKNYEEIGNIYYIFISVELEIIQEISNNMLGKVDLYFYEGFLKSLTMYHRISGLILFFQGRK